MAKNPSRFLALLRGINVGGKNIIAKDDLRASFEDLGFTDVSTYIQSGNVLFSAKQSAVRPLTALIEAGLSERFSYDARAVVLSKRKYDSIIAAAPPGWGTDENQKHNALFVLAGATSRGIVAKLPDPKPKIEAVSVGPGVIYWSISKQNQSKTSYHKLVSNSVYSQVTIRNHNTVHKLHQMLAE